MSVVAQAEARIFNYRRQRFLCLTLSTRTKVLTNKVFSEREPLFLRTEGANRRGSFYRSQLLWKFC